jgi:hypothetical protein
MSHGEPFARRACDTYVGVPLPSAGIIPTLYLCEAMMSNTAELSIALAYLLDGQDNSRAIWGLLHSPLLAPCYSHGQNSGHRQKRSDKASNPGTYAVPGEVAVRYVNGEECIVAS